MKLDLWNTYHLILIWEGYEWKTQFDSPTGHWAFDDAIQAYQLSRIPGIRQLCPSWHAEPIIVWPGWLNFFQLNGRTRGVCLLSNLASALIPTVCESKDMWIPSLHSVLGSLSLSYKWWRTLRRTRSGFNASWIFITSIFHWNISLMGSSLHIFTCVFLVPWGWDSFSYDPV